MPSCPRYLAKHADLWARDPRAANLAWFREAKWGLFLHYGLYSQLARHEWAMFKDRIPVAEYERLFDTFDPARFDAEAITDLAIAAGMSYVNLTTCHHEGFCLWDSATEPFNAKRAAGRDLVRELGEACDRKGLGFFCYFTHVLNWRHPYAPTHDLIPMGRPDYQQPEPRYQSDRPEDWRRYWEWAHGCLRELCAFDFPVAGIWLDIIRMYYVRPEHFPLAETYRLIREGRPEALLSFKQGATGEEDYAAPEFHFHSQGEELRKEGKPVAGTIADAAWAKNKDKHNEICMTLQDGSWGYHAERPWKDAEAVWRSLAYAGAHDCNLLANIGPKADGSLPTEGVAILKSIGERIRREGWPAPDANFNPRSASGAGAA